MDVILSSLSLMAESLLALVRGIAISTRASRSTCTPRKHQCEMTDNINAHVAE